VISLAPGLCHDVGFPGVLFGVEDPKVFLISSPDHRSPEFSMDVAPALVYRARNTHEYP
jgi:hypothetical protein